MAKAKPANGIKEKTVATPCEDYTTIMEVLRLIHCLMEGTRGMRAAGKEFLPQEKGEENDAYSARLLRTFLLNVFKRTVQKMSGEVFSRPVNISSDFPDEFTGMMKDIDRQGSTIDMFARKVFEAGVADGATHILVEFPQIDKISKNGIDYFFDQEGYDKAIAQGDRDIVIQRAHFWKPLTKKAELEHGWRPYLCHYKVKDVIGWRYETVNGRPHLKQVRLRELVEVEDGDFGTKKVERIRVIEPNKYTIWEPMPNKDNEWYIVDEGTTDYRLQGNAIPFFTFATGEKVTQMTAVPPLEGLADLNLQHYQSSSDQRNILHFARVCLWFGKMLDVDDETGNVKFGPNQIIMANDPEADLKVVEHSGNAISAGREDLKDIENQMSMYGLTYMMPRTGDTTATAKAIDSAENDSSLKSWALGFAHVMEGVFHAIMVMSNLGDTMPENPITVNTEFKSFLNTVEPDILLKSWQGGMISREVCFNEFIRRGIVASETDFVDMVSQIEKEYTDKDLGGLQGGFGS